MKALLFDLDGTLAHTDRLHEEGWRQVLAPYSLEVTHAFYQQKISGRLNPDIVANLLPQLPRAEQLALADRKEALFRALPTFPAAVDGLNKLWSWAGQQGWQRALVTNAPRANVRHVVDHLNLNFDLEVLAEDLAAGKPNPLPYLTALRQLGLEAADAVVFEDTPSGIHSAVGAGITTVGLTTGHSEQVLLDAGARFTIADFADPKLWEWLAQFSA
jgi:beta-phosphoglucomutase-like phosphatase (HAD superfamily)